MPELLETTSTLRDGYGDHDLLVLESCQSTWAFDPERRVFARAGRGTPVAAMVTSATWMPYARVEVGATAFAVVLSADGTQRIRAQRHTEPCRHCGARDDRWGSSGRTARRLGGPPDPSDARG